MSTSRPTALHGVTAALLVALAAAPAAPGEPGPQDALSQVARLELRRAPAGDVVPLLKDPNPAVRERALVALARLQDPLASNSVLGMAQDPEARVRAAAAFALGELDPVLPWPGPADGRPRLATEMARWLTSERDPSVRAALYRALGLLAPASQLDPLVQGLGSPADGNAAALGLALHGHRRRAEANHDGAVAQALSALLTDPAADTRRAATQALFRLSHKAAEPYVSRLAADPDPGVRYYAARALSGNAAGAEALRRALLDPEWTVQVEAIRSLAAAPAPRGLAHAGDVAALVETVRSCAEDVAAGRNPARAHVVVAGCEALCRTPSARKGLLQVEQRLSQAPKAPWQTRCAVARALDVLDGAPRRVGVCGPAGAKVLRELEVRVAVAVSDVGRAAAAAPYLAHAQSRVRGKAAEVLSSLDPKEVPDLLEAVRQRLAAETDPGVLATLADILKEHPDAANVAALRAALSRLGVASGDAAEATVSVLDALGVSAVDQERALVDKDLEALASSPSRRVRASVRAVRAAWGRDVGPVAAMAPALWPMNVLPERATLHTEKGDVTVRFYREDAPLAVSNFITLARQGFYKGTRFHRVVSAFVAQGGDPRGDGFGGPGYTIPCEYNPRPYRRGTLGMALSGKDSGGSQFFITHTPQPHLDGAYTAFGEVESGMEVVDALQQDDVLLDVVARAD